MPESDLPAGPSHCSGCQQRLPAGVRYCPHCGRNVVNGFDPGVRIATAPVKSDFDVRWKNVRMVAWLFGLLLATSFVFGLVEHQYHSPWVDVIASSIDALLVLGFAIARRVDIGPLFALPRCDRRSTLILASVAVGFIALMSAYFDLLTHLGIPMLRMTDEYRNAGWPVGAMFLLVSVMPGIIEEIGFRGVIQSLLERAVDAREAWLIQAALFSVLHLSPIVFPSHFVMGLVFGYLRLRSRSLYPGMLLHSSWNALQVFAEI
jgi:membrane protease YdiL (CAAX protease family)